MLLSTHQAVVDVLSTAQYSHAVYPPAATLHLATTCLVNQAWNGCKQAAYSLMERATVNGCTRALQATVASDMFARIPLQVYNPHDFIFSCAGKRACRACDLYRAHALPANTTTTMTTSRTVTTLE